LTPPQILISAGEASSEMYAARLATALQQRTGAHLFGMGGHRMRESGVELVADAGEIAVVGIFEVLKKLPAVFRIRRRLMKEAAARHPALAILIDSPGFNLGLARQLRNQGVRVVYFIGPQVWAWRPGRVRWIKRRVERMLVIFHFEEEFYRKRGVAATYIGHPLVDTVHPSMTRDEFIKQNGLDPKRPLVAVLPGSRPGEIGHHLPVILETCKQLRSELRPASPQFVLAAASSLTARDFMPYLQGVPDVSVIEGQTYNVLAAADCAIVSSGTATVEAGLLGVPMVVIYRLSRLTAFVARHLVSTPFFGMVNLILGKAVVPELIQDDFTPQALAAETKHLLTSPAAREEMKRDLGELGNKMGPGGAIDRAAEVIAGMLGS
jgi:lipid-A-disaccharide synthase